MPAAGHQLGIDFGTSNTVAVVRWPDGRVRPLIFDGSPLLPSAVYAEPAGGVIVGRDAVHSSRLDPARFEPNPKRRIDDGSLFLGTSEIPVPQVFAYVLQQVALEAQRQAGQMPGQVRLTHPARWGERRRVTIDADHGALGADEACDQERNVPAAAADVEHADAAGEARVAQQARGEIVAGHVPLRCRRAP